MRPHGLWTAILVAVVLTGLNALKPVMMDDTAYYQLARQIAQAPFDPYGFAQYWYDRPQPASTLLAPPVFPYWFGLCLAIFGEHPVAWKLALFPFALLLSFSVRALANRFTPGLTSAMLLLVVLSPAVLPSFNLMLDVPALALSLGAVVLFLNGVDRESWLRVILAGLAAGIAMQTKYTAFVTPGVLLLYAWRARRFTPGLVAVCLAPGVFLAWELVTIHLYGESHFWYQVTHPNPEAPPRSRLVLPFLAYLGGLTPAVTMLGLAGLGRLRLAVFWAGWVVMGHALLAAVPAEHAVLLRSESGRELLSLNSVLFGSLGIASLAVLGTVAVRLGRAAPDSRFLAAWFALELIGYFALSPFPAARRLLGLIVVSTVLVGRFVALRCRDSQNRLVLNAAVILGVLFGIGYFTLDCVDARLELEGAEKAETWIRERDPEGRIWFLGTWGFKFHAERRGMTHLIPERSEVKPGNWLVIAPRDGIPPKYDPLAHGFQRRSELAITSPLPLHTYSAYYGGHRPLDPGWNKQLVVSLYQAEAGGTPQGDSRGTAATGGKTAAPAAGK